MVPASGCFVDMQLVSLNLECGECVCVCVCVCVVCVYVRLCVRVRVCAHVCGRVLQ